jgi:V/A-type H+-transporting ATPase subunit I
MLVLDKPVPPWLAYLAIPGLVLVFLFMVPFRRIKKEFAGLVMFPFDVIGNFVDLVSYVRLFAVGSASLAVAVAFNNLALSLGFNSVLTGLVAALIIFVGHALNIVLCIMSVLVHGVRLNTLEFSGHIGLEWSGFRYAPFAKRPRPGNVR